MDKKSLDAILGDFDLSKPPRMPAKKNKRPATFWLPADYKDAYAEIQRKSKGRFSGVVRELIMAAIDHARTTRAA